MTAEEGAAFAKAVAGVTDRHWSRAADAGATDVGDARLGVLWAVGAEHGWFALRSVQSDGTADDGTAGGGQPGSLPIPLQPLLVGDAWRRIDAAAEAGNEGALRLESFFIGQVVGALDAIRPAAEITRQIIADCEQRIAELVGLLPRSSNPDSEVG